MLKNLFLYNLQLSSINYTHSGICAQSTRISCGSNNTEKGSVQKFPFVLKWLEWTPGEKNLQMFFRLGLYLEQADTENPANSFKSINIAITGVVVAQWEGSLTSTLKFPVWFQLCAALLPICGAKKKKSEKSFIDFEPLHHWRKCQALMWTSGRQKLNHSRSTQTDRCFYIHGFSNVLVNVNC